MLVLSEPILPNPDEKTSDDAPSMPAVISRAGAGTCDYNLLQQLAMDAVQKGQDYDMLQKVSCPTSQQNGASSWSN